MTNFDFDNEELILCGSETKVLFKINNEDVNEAIAFIFEPPVDSLFFRAPEEPIEIALNGENLIVYRTFDSEVEASYFCNEIPPTMPNVIEEYESTTGGTVTFTATLTNLDDLDGDGVSSETEGMNIELDTDQDGIPDYLDIDDDGDHVLTEEEVSVETELFASGFPDSDGDGTPNYLDPDDDNDQTPTIREDWDEDGNPVNDINEEGLEYYLDPESSTSFAIVGSIPNTIFEQYRYEVNVLNLTLKKQGDTGEQIRIENYDLGFFDLPSIEITYPLEEPGEGDGTEDGEGTGEGDTEQTDTP